MFKSTHPGPPTPAATGIQSPEAPPATRHHTRVPTRAKYQSHGYPRVAGAQYPGIVAGAR